MRDAKAVIQMLLNARRARDWGRLDKALDALSSAEQADVTWREHLERFVAAYNDHDIESLLAELAPDASVHDEAWDERIEGPDSLRAHYRAEFEAAPDIAIEVRGMFPSGELVALDLRITGTHEGPWRGLPGTGRGFDLVCRGIARVDLDTGLIRSVRYGYDRALLFQQLGLLHDPNSAFGRAVTMLMHPVTMARIAGRRISARPPAPPA